MNNISTTVLVEIISCILDFETPAVSMEEVKDMAELIPGLSEDINFLTESFKNAGIELIVPEKAPVVIEAPKPEAAVSEVKKEEAPVPEEHKKSRGNRPAKYISIRGLIEDVGHFIKKTQSKSGKDWLPVVELAEKFAKEKALGINQRASIRDALRQQRYSKQTANLWLYDKASDMVSVV